MLDQYACLWLDNTGGGGLTGQDGSIFHTTFTYSRDSDTWQWGMDGEAGGKLQPFALVKLTRK